MKAAAAIVTALGYLAVGGVLIPVAFVVHLVSGWDMGTAAVVTGLSAPLVLLIWFWLRGDLKAQSYSGPTIRCKCGEVVKDIPPPQPGMTMLCPRCRRELGRR